MFFYALTSAGPQGWCWNLSLKGEGFNYPQGVQQMLMHQKTMFDHYYCIKSFCHLKTLEKRFEKLFLYYYNGVQKHEGFVGFENAWSRAKTCLILTSLYYVNSNALYCWWLQFLWRPRMRICKVQKLCINSTWIGWLIHGFLPVKTWL